MLTEKLSFCENSKKIIIFFFFFGGGGVRSGVGGGVTGLM